MTLSRFTGQHYPEDRRQRTEGLAALRAEWGETECSVFRSSPGAKRHKPLCLLSSQTSVL
ncbi:MAG: hypothetical protein LBD06_12125 [Candidatus Accumulibacter sp.]|nr:hypothetical protein [Accumulibacter sp.]